MKGEIKRNKSPISEEFKLIDNIDNQNKTSRDKGKDIFLNYVVKKTKFNKNKFNKPSEGKYELKNGWKSKIPFILLILNSLIIQTLPIYKLFPLEYWISQISLKINGIGEKNIFCSETNHFPETYYPDEVHINEVKQDNVSYSYYLYLTENYVKLIWINALNNCEYLFNKCSDIIEMNLSNFDTSQVTIMNYMFSGCSSLSSLELSNFNTSKVENMKGMFEDCSSLTSIDLSNFDTSQVTYMDYMFAGCSSLTSLNLLNFDTSKTFWLDHMFYKCSSLTSLDLSNFDTSKVQYMEYMFSGCYLLTSLDLSNFDTKEVKWFTHMFEDCSLLVSLNLSNFNNSNAYLMDYMFSGCSLLSSIDLSCFYTSQVTNMEGMFYGCSSLTSLDLSNFDTSKVDNMQYMFADCSLLSSLDLSNFDTSKVENMKSMFDDCSSLSTMQLTHFNISRVKYMDYIFAGCSSLTSLDLSNFDTKEVLWLDHMFYKCSSLTSLDLSNFDTSKVQYMEYMFSGCSSLTSLDLSNFDTKEVLWFTHMFEDCSSLIFLNLSNFNNSNAYLMDYMFSGCSSLSSIDLTNFYTSQATNMNYMFYGCSSLTSLNLSSFDTSKVKSMVRMFSSCSNISTIDLSHFYNYEVTNMDYMFFDCSSLLSLDLSSFSTLNLESMCQMFEDCSSLTSVDLSNFNTSQVKRMDYLFSGCSSLSSLDLSSFDISQVTWIDHMFYECSSLTSLDLSNFNTSKVQYMEYMFSGCSSLSSLDLSNFDTRDVIWLKYMFENCSSLKFLNLSNFENSKAYYMDYMFKGCTSLLSIDFTNFYTSQSTNMNYMFYGCSSLTSLNLSSFNTSKVEYMENMFYDCSSLKFLNLSNFDTSGIKSMNYMFYNCLSLTSLDVSNFDTSQVTNMQYMFSNCTSLSYLDLSSFDTSKVSRITSMFDGCVNLEFINFNSFSETKLNSYYSKNIFNNVPGNIIICVNDNNLILLSEINKTGCYIIDCSDEWYLKKNIIINETRECILKCYDRYEYHGKCYDNCSNGYYIDNYNNISKCKCELEKCFSCSPPALELNLCTECNNDYYPMENDSSNIGEYFNCYKEIEGYYIDYNDSLFKKCYYTCETCEIKGDNITHNCLICNTDYNYSIIINMSNYFNCYNYSDYEIITTLLIKVDTTIPIETTIIKMPTYETYNEISTREIQTLSTSEPYNEKSTNIEITSFRIYETYLVTSKKDIMEIEYYENSNYTADEINQKIYEQIVDLFLENFEDLEGEEKIIEGKDNFFYHLTTLENELDSIEGNNNKTNKFSKIDLGECEDILRETYHTDKNISLLMVKYEKITNISSERNLQYEIYEPINKTKLNLSVCKEVSIDIYVPVALSDKLKDLYDELKDLGYDLFDIDSDFYQDICTPYKSANGTDVLLSDRVNTYFGNEETQCQPGCQFSDYSLEAKNLKCECNVENTEINFDNNNNDNKKNEIGSKSIYKSFYDILKFSNYKVLKCYKLAFSLNIFKNNKGNFLVLVFFTVYLVFLVIYFMKGTTELKNDLSVNIINNNLKNRDNGEISSNLNSKNEQKIKINFKSIKNINAIRSNNKNNNNRFILNKTLKKKRYKPRIIFDFPPKKTLYHINNIKIFNEELLNSNKNKNYDSKNAIVFSKREVNGINDIQKICREILPTTNEEKLDSFELNNLDYNKAINLDKRKFWEIYWSILKREHLIIFTFFIRNDHNIQYVKYSRFIFSVCTDMALNVFFFSDETMHKMFLDYGKYNFIQQIPQIVYSTIVSQLIELVLSFLSLTDKYYYQIKNLNIKMPHQIIKIAKFIQIKIYFFFAFTGIMFLFYWYIITCFCSVYENTQAAFIKDSFLSFGLGLLYPIPLYLLPTILRIISLKSCKGKLAFIYKMSEIIPFF